MATPTLVDVHIDLVSLVGAVDGTVVFTAHRPLIGAASIMPPFSKTVVVEDGEATASLPATNDPAWLPLDWEYSVAIHAGGGARGSMQLDYQAGLVELATVLQVDSAAESGVSYLTLNQVGVAGGVAELDDDGDVIDADGNKITGGGGGAVDSVNGETGVVVLDATDVGADPSGTAASAVAAHLAAGDPHPQYLTASEGNAAYAASSHTHPASQISDSTTTGRAVLTAADAATARTAIGAGTSSLALGTTGSTAAAGNDSRLSDARTPTAHASSHASAGSDPITVAESQVTNLTTDLAAKAPLASPALTGTPTAPTATAGTNTTQVATTAFVTTAVAGAGGGTVNSVNGENGDVVLDAADVGAQPVDADLTAVAALTPANDDVIQRKAGAWTNRTIAQLKTDLGLTKSDVGLGNVDNTADASKSFTASQVSDSTSTGRAVLTATDAAAARTAISAQPLDADLTTIAGLTATTDNFMVANASAWASRTPSQAKTALALVKGDVGLGNVDNTSDATKNAAAVTLTNKTLTSPAITTPTGIVVGDISGAAPLASPTFTGTPSLPTGATGVTQTAADSSTKLATTAFVTTADNLKANLASPTFTGTPTLPTGTIATTQSAGNNTTAVATTAFVAALGALKADLASPTFTGTPTLPTGTVATTQSGGDSSTKVATTAFATGADAVRPVNYYDTAGTYGTVSGSRIFIGSTTPTSPADGDIWFDTTGT